MSGKKDGTASLEEIIASEKAKAQSAAHRPWHDHVDRLIEERLSVAAMARVFESLGVKVGRRTVNDWLLRNRKEPTEYLRVKKGVERQTQTVKVDPVAEKLGEENKRPSLMPATEEQGSKQAVNGSSVNADAPEKVDGAKRTGLTVEDVLAYVRNPANKV